MKPICITFAGPFGSSKSPIAQYLSCELGWPILGNDPIRNEIKEDLLQNTFDRAEMDKRAVERLARLIGRGQNFIFDSSSDRRWLDFLDNFNDHPYHIGVISIDLSPEFYSQIIEAKQYALDKTAQQTYLRHHEDFLGKYPETVICHITDQTFRDRLALSLQAVETFIGDK